MSERCHQRGPGYRIGDDGCRHRAERPMRVFLSPLTGRAYATTDYDEKPTLGMFVANTKVDVTEDVVHELMARAWAKGWNDCNAAPEGASPPNPYRPTQLAQDHALTRRAGNDETNPDPHPPHDGRATEEQA